MNFPVPIPPPEPTIYPKGPLSGVLTGLSTAGRIDGSGFQLLAGVELQEGLAGSEAEEF